MRPVDVSILTSAHDVADARLHREVAALTATGLDVEVLGLGDPADGPPGASVRTWRRPSGVRRALRALALPWRAGGSVLLTLDPDVAAGAWVCRALRRLGPRARRVRVVADVHEDYRLLLRDRAWARGLRRLGGAAWARLGERAAVGADLTVVADDGILRGAPRRVVLRNLPDLSMLPEPAPRDAVPRALYVGDLRASRGLFAMLELAERLPEWRLDLVGPIAAADRDEAVRRLADPSLRDRVRWHDRQPPREAWRHASGAWVGLLLLDSTPAFRQAVPSKLYEYMACGLAVVATDLPRVAEIVRDSGAGALVSDASEAVAVLRRWSEQPAELDRARASAAAWSRRAPSGDMAGFVDAVRRLVREPAPSDGGRSA